MTHTATYTLDRSEEVAAEVLAERRRQINDLGYTPDHDRIHHHTEELPRAAAALAANDGLLWPFGWGKFEYAMTRADASMLDPDYCRARRRQLIKSAALAIAEVERLDAELGTL